MNHTICTSESLHSCLSFCSVCSWWPICCSCLKTHIRTPCVDARWTVPLKQVSSLSRRMVCMHARMCVQQQGPNQVLEDDWEFHLPQGWKHWCYQWVWCLTVGMCAHTCVRSSMSYIKDRVTSGRAVQATNQFRRRWLRPGKQHSFDLSMPLYHWMHVVCMSVDFVFTGE